MAKMTVTTDFGELEQDIQSAIRLKPNAALQALRIEQLETMNDSQREVPVDEGILRNSKITPAPFLRAGVATAILGYNAVYALRVHENPRSGQTGGVSPRGQRYRRYARVGKWKFLEHPMQRRERGFGRRVGRYILAQTWR